MCVVDDDQDDGDDELSFSQQALAYDMIDVSLKMHALLLAIVKEVHAYTCQLKNKCIRVCLFNLFMFT